MNPRFAEYTEKITRALPYWFKMKKKSKESNGTLFLNVIGLELDNIKYVLDYAYQQTLPQLADTTIPDIIYKAILPMNIKGEDITEVKTLSKVLTEAKNLSYFFKSPLNGEDYSNVPTDLYILDIKKNILFFRNMYDADVDNLHGNISYVVDDVIYQCKIHTHQLWNFFDEFGLLLDCSRLNLESNVSYKERILDVFKSPAGAHKNGLVNGVARELNLRHNKIIEDGGVDYYITDKMVMLNSIKVDNEYIPLEEIFINNENCIVIQGKVDYNNTKRTVSYVTDLEIHQLWNKEDYKLYNELFNADGSSTVLLKYYKEKILSMSPIAWDYFRWDESYWDISNSDTGGNAFVPNFYDAKINGFVDYDL